MSGREKEEKKEMMGTSPPTAVIKNLVASILLSVVSDFAVFFSMFSRFPNFFTNTFQQPSFISFKHNLDKSFYWEWRRFHNEEVHSLLNKVRVIKCRRLRLAGHVARMEKGRSSFKILTGNLQEIDHQEGRCIDGRTILERILKKQVSIRQIVLIRLRLEITGEPL